MRLRRNVLGLSLALAIACITVAGAAEKKSVPAKGVSPTDLKIDLALKALRMPVLQPVLVLPQGKGAPARPLYKEQPPAAQNDFRPPPPAPEPVPSRANGREDEEEDEDEPEAPAPPPQQQLPCSPNHPNWPNC